MYLKATNQLHPRNYLPKNQKKCWQSTNIGPKNKNDTCTTVALLVFMHTLHLKR